MTNKIIIHEDSLREAEQAPGNSMTMDEKLDVAKDFAAMGIDVIQAGFPIASPGDKEAVRIISGAIQGPEISALARVEIPRHGCKISFKDIDECREALDPAKKRRLHMVVSTSEKQNQVKWPGITIEQIADFAVQSIMHTREVFGPNVTIQFSPEDAGRTSVEHLIYVASRVTEAGAHCFNIADTVGYADPMQFSQMVRKVHDSVPAFKDGRAYISVHCHDRLGLAVANALAAVQFGGARQVETCMCGLGDTGGLAATERVVMAIKARQDLYGTGRFDHINTRMFYPVAHKIADYMDVDISRMTLVGEYGMSHESGMHASACIKGEKQGVLDVYDIINTNDIGWDGERYPVGKHSGWRQVQKKLKALGYKYVREKLAREVQKRVNEIADRQKYVADHQLDGIMEEKGRAPQVEKYKITYWHLDDRIEDPAKHMSSSGDTPAEAIITMSGPNLQERTTRAMGNGPVDAAVHAICQCTGISREMIAFKIRGLKMTSGSGAPGRADVKIRDHNGKEVIHSGIEVDRDIAYAAAQAYVNALNRMLIYHALKSG